MEEEYDILMVDKSLFITFKQTGRVFELIHTPCVYWKTVKHLYNMVNKSKHTIKQITCTGRDAATNAAPMISLTFNAFIFANGEAKSICIDFQECQ